MSFSIHQTNIQGRRLTVKQSLRMEVPSRTQTVKMRKSLSPKEMALNKVS
jgi:hypothetical protein